MARVSPRAIHALVVTCTKAMDALVARGRPIEPWVYSALEDTARYARGENVLKAKRVARWKQLEAASERYSVHSPELDKAYYWAVGAAGTLLRMAATGENWTELVVTHLGYGLTGWGSAEVEGWYATALAQGTLSDAPVARRPRSARTLLAEKAGLARAAKALGKGGAALLAACGARHDPKRTCDSATLTALLKRYRYPAHASVLAFERDFGGLVLRDDGGEPADDSEDWFTNGPSCLMGAYACLRSGGHEHPDGGAVGLVPVVYASNDEIVFVDVRGRTFIEDIESDKAVKFTSTTAAMVRTMLTPS